MNQNRIFLIGLPSSGKSKIGSILAKRMRYKFSDTDNLIIQKCNNEFGSFENIQECYSFLGEVKFRETEKQVLKELINNNLLDFSIISTGGGIILDPDNRNLIKNNGVVIFLNIPLEIIKERLEHQKERPLFKGKSIETRIKELQSQRLSLMKDLADIIIEATGSADEICMLIISKL